METTKEITNSKQLFISLFKGFKYVYFFSWYLATFLLVIYLFAIIMPERVANNPIVTQFTTMAANLLSFLVGYFFGGVADKSKQPVPTVAVASDTSNTDQSTNK